jgi:hypothetical protein
MSLHLVKDPLPTFATVVTFLAAAVFRPGLLGRHMIGIGSGQQDHIPALALVIVALTIATFALLGDFAARLAKIIATVGRGAPFTLVNAAQLTRMGWLVMSVEAINISQTLITTYLSTNGIDTHVSLTALSVGLVLFILAREFPNGVTLREDLEERV